MLCVGWLGTFHSPCMKLVTTATVVRLNVAREEEPYFLHVVVLSPPSIYAVCTPIRFFWSTVHAQRAPHLPCSSLDSISMWCWGFFGYGFGAAMPRVEGGGVSVDLEAGWRTRGNLPRAARSPFRYCACSRAVWVLS